MIKGIGIDLVELARIKDAYERNPRFAERILSENELSRFKTLSEKRRIEFLAGRFAAKEAYAKANGSGIGGELSFQDMEIATGENGKPYFVKPKRVGVHVSISHSDQYAIAQVIIEDEGRFSLFRKNE